MFKSNFDYQLVRGMLAGAYGEGGAFGELYSTARRIVRGCGGMCTVAILARAAFSLAA